MSSASDIVQPQQPASFHKANNNNNTVVKRQHIVEMLYATRHGRRIALSTLKALLTAAQRTLPNVVSLPPLIVNKKNGKETKVTVVGDLHGSLSDTV